MNIQIINCSGENEKYSCNQDIIVSMFNAPRSLDEFDLNIIDLSEPQLWKYQGKSFDTIDEINNLHSISVMIKKCKKTDILIIVPRNINVEWFNNTIRYINAGMLKDFLTTLNTIILNILPNKFRPFLLYFENTRTTINGKIYQADFCFEVYENAEVITLSNKSEKITTVKCGERILVTSLDATSDVKKLQNFLDFLFIKDRLEEIPDWVRQMDFFDDCEQKGLVEKERNEIEKAQKQIERAEMKLKENLRYKSILYSNGDDLVRVVFEILENILDCDLSKFEDIKKEDFLIKKDNYTFIGEIKGVTSNVKNEHISQVDVHYQKYMDKLNEEKIQERVKEILIINAFRNKNLNEREPINAQQIQLAKRNGCLIIETITLLKLFECFKQGKCTSEKCEDVFFENEGLLKIDDFM